MMSLAPDPATDFFIFSLDMWKMGRKGGLYTALKASNFWQYPH